MDDAGGPPTVEKPPLRYCPHCSGKLDEARLIEWGGWSFDEETGTLMPGNLHFSPNESGMLGMMLRRRGQPTRRTEHLYAAICGNRPDADWPDMKIVDVLICRMRNKLRAAGLDLIGSTWGVGYHAIEYDPERVPKPSQSSMNWHENREPGRNTLCACGHLARAHNYDQRRQPKHRRRGCRQCECNEFQHKDMTGENKNGV